MPTLGWILETASDRYWERGGGGSAATTPTTHHCHFCNAVFDTAAECARHVSVDHPLERPILCINGRPVESEFVLRSASQLKDISCTNCQQVRLVLDGTLLPPLTPDQFTKELEAHKGGFYQVTLQNQRIVDGAGSSASYVVRVSISSDQSLNEVDELFVRCLAIDDLNLPSIRKFIDMCSRFTDTVDYIDALCSYTVGVLVKDQDLETGVTLEFASFVEKFQAAISVLADYDRPLAQTVAACIRFNLNDFSKFYSPTGVTLLDEAMAILRHFAGASIVIPDAAKHLGREVQPACPIDHSMSQLLAVFAALRSASKLDAETAWSVQAAIASGTTSDHDRVKYRVILADAALRAGNIEYARSPLRALAHDYAFGAWATSQLRLIGDA